jgi:hypothetical protein
LVPVLQLRRDDFPEMPFFPDTDLFQLLWCPADHDDPVFVAKPFVFWRNARWVRKRLHTTPSPGAAEKTYLPKPCRLFPERVTEYPSMSDLPAQLREKLEASDPEDLQDMLDGAVVSDPETLYDWELSVCPSTKVGGYVCWAQDAEVPACACGRPMEQLLTLADMEFDGGTYRRWLSEEDRGVWDGPTEKRLAVQDAPHWGLGGGFLYLFICRRCRKWPVQSVYQR